MIKFQDLSKKYGKISALHEINLEIKPGEFVFLVGPSGAGKSTLIKLLIREELPTEGEVFYEDIPLSLLKEKYLHLLRQEIGVVFQDYKLLETKTVGENVAFGLNITQRSEEEIGNKVSEALDIVEIKDLADQFPAQLSGGERQRVAIARAVALEPKVFVADEPTGNIDPKMTDSLFRVFEKINESGITVIVATHAKEKVDKMQKRVVELKAGEIVRDERKGKYKK
jgi:cell division transport system ATP-binding protein